MSNNQANPIADTVMAICSTAPNTDRETDHHECPPQPDVTLYRTRFSWVRNGFPKSKNSGGYWVRIGLGKRAGGSQ